MMCMGHEARGKTRNTRAAQEAKPRGWIGSLLFHQVKNGGGSESHSPGKLWFPYFVLVKLNAFWQMNALHKRQSHHILLCWPYIIWFLLSVFSGAPRALCHGGISPHAARRSGRLRGVKHGFALRAVSLRDFRNHTVLGNKVFPKNKKARDSSTFFWNKTADVWCKCTIRRQFFRYCPSSEWCPTDVDRMTVTLLGWRPALAQILPFRQS